MSRIPVDCLNEIFEYLEYDKFSLRSCILVNRLWCELSMRILWRDVWNYSTSNFITLIACLPNESKEILYENGIIISASTSKTPTFNYASFCKVLSFGRVYFKIGRLLKDQQNILRLGLDNKTNIVSQEIFKMFMKEIPSLRSLSFFTYPKLIFKLYPGTKDCLKNLSQLHCSSDYSSEIFYQLSQICYNIQSFTLNVEKIVSNGLVDLISVQRNLKFFSILYYGRSESVNGLSNRILSLMSKFPNILTELVIYGENNHLSLSFIANFSNLQELALSFNQSSCFIDFEKLQYVIFSRLHVLKINKRYPRVELLIKFLENNGKNLKEIYIGESERAFCSDNSLNLAIAKFCPNLRKLSVGIKYNELETLKIIFNSCKNLESIRIWCGEYYLNEKEALETFTNYSSQNIYELILYYRLYEVRVKLLPKELESFFTSWVDRKPQKSLSLIIVKNNEISLVNNNENVEIINKYIKLGVVKKFIITDFTDFEYNF
ncbi:hypothetical protein RclHR1_05220007 [Rhizophagus clarus]|uniref:F-box domain-containing protein n=1 Tax=Rhizophagus clarus TaxID=94130 RepID=A0A2Z6S3F6_9GLOM|nr:hypothetical protein RclHR1_05220007 [Rhizophagus clarus]GES79147.1 hypothetical protein GLOIN_2v1784405 [Rhizophagus clarus]